MRRLSDTSAEAQQILTIAYRKMPPSRKIQWVCREFRLARSLHHAGQYRLHPDRSEAEIRHSWITSMLGNLLTESIKGGGSLNEDMDNLAVLQEVLAAFHALGIAYAIGGSWASSYYGEPRMTRDADVSVDPFSGKEQMLADHFGPDYYMSVDAFREANRTRSTFNIIHTSTAFKVDVFVRKNDPFETSVMSRRSAGEAAADNQPPLVWVSPEDLVLLKLRWYRLGNEISDRQWSDVLGVFRVQAGRLDEDYLTHWAKEIGVANLLARARSESS